MQHLEVSGAVRPLQASLSVKGLTNLMHKILFYNKFIIYLYMFQALRAHYQGSKLYYTACGIITPVGGHPVHRSSLNLCMGWPPTECDDTRCCIIQF